MTKNYSVDLKKFHLFERRFNENIFRINVGVTKSLVSKVVFKHYKSLFYDNFVIWIFVILSLS